MTRQEGEVKGEEMPLFTKTAKYSTHRQPSGCSNKNTFTQALSFLMLNNPLYCEKQMWTVLNPAGVHIYVRLELSVKIKTEGEGKTKTSTSLGSTPQTFKDLFCLY